MSKIDPFKMNDGRIKKTAKQNVKLSKHKNIRHIFLTVFIYIYFNTTIIEMKFGEIKTNFVVYHQSFFVSRRLVVLAHFLAHSVHTTQNTVHNSNNNIIRFALFISSPLYNGSLQTCNFKHFTLVALFLIISFHFSFDVSIETFTIENAPQQKDAEKTLENKKKRGNARTEHCNRENTHSSLRER